MGIVEPSSEKQQQTETAGQRAYKPETRVETAGRRHNRRKMRQIRQFRYELGLAKVLRGEKP